MNSVPSNCILFKTLTGIGATHLEIQTGRHSIIIEPNVPVIKGKKKAHSTILAVHEGVYIPEIENYLNDTKIRYKKIITTPESFAKVKEAIAECELNMYQDFFLMFDECDRTSKDVDFRKDIILPMEDFFKFENKAFVSATATIPSDKRFEQQGFEILEIVPRFDYRKPLNLVQTNNPFSALRNSLQEIISVKDKESIFIFLNSTVGIMSIIERLGIQGQSTIFCSSNSSKKIKSNGISVCSDIDTSKFKKFNFLTSRFYSAVDIYVKEKPHVILITDLNIADHTMIDPYSDLIQVAGRFRDIQLASLTFIANHNTKISYRSEEEAKAYLNGCAETYKTIQSLRDVTNNDGAKETLTEALERITYSRFLNEDGTINRFMIDNYIHKEQLKSLFTNQTNLENSFKSPLLQKQFKVRKYLLNFNVPSFYPKVNGIQKYIDIVRRISDFLEDVYSCEKDDFCLDIKEYVLKDIEATHPEMVEAYNKLGKDMLCKIGYSKKLVNNALERFDKEVGGRNNFEFLDELNATFAVNEFYSGNIIKDNFVNLVEKYKLPYTNKKRYLNDFKRFFNLSNRTSRNKKKGYVILERKFN